MDRIELRGSDGLVYGEIVDGVIVIASRQSRKNRTIQYEKWDKKTGALLTTDQSDVSCIHLSRQAQSPSTERQQ